MPHKSLASSMFNAVAIVSALHLLSEGVFPTAEGTGEPYGISRQVVEGAARAGASLGSVAPGPRQLDDRPVPALNQVVAGGDTSGGEVDDDQILLLPGENDDNFTNEGPTLVTTTSRAPTFDPSADDDDLRSTAGKAPASIPTCKDGRGVIRFEKIPDTKMVKSPRINDVIRRNETPVLVMQQCRDHCLRDQTAQSSLHSPCVAFDFSPGTLINRYQDVLEFTESKCFLSRPDDSESLKDTLTDEPGQYHYREVCYTSTSVIQQECQSRMNVMELRRGLKFLPANAQEVPADNLADCQDKCLNQYANNPHNTNRMCRAGSWDGRRCYHTSYTMRTHPSIAETNPNYDYFENTCLTVDRRCPKDKLIFVKEVNKEMGGSHDTEVHKNIGIDECIEKCLDGENIFCRSLEYKERSRTCVLSDEDSVSKPKDLRASNTDQNVYYQLYCIDGEKVHGEYRFEESDTQQLNQRRYRNVRTAFQLHRKTRLELTDGFRGSRGRDIERLTLAECLDECLEEREFVCRSVMYSERFQDCRLSEYDELNGDIVYDPEYDYFENLMENLVVQTSSSTNESPVAVTGDKTGVLTPNGGTRDSGPGSAGQTGTFRPGSRFNGNRGSGSSSSSFGSFGSSFSGSRFQGSDDRFNNGGSSHGGAGGRVGGNGLNGRDVTSDFNRRFRPDDPSRPLNPSRPAGNSDRPGLFRPISTADFSHRDSSGRQTGSGGSFGFSNGGRGSSNGGRGSSNGGRGSSNGAGGSGRQTISGFGGLFPGTATADGSNLAEPEVSQECTDVGMEFQMRTDERFFGRIYTYGYYSQCFTKGNGEFYTTLRISGPGGSPNCGTTRYGDTKTNIVVVQFAENVQTSQDMRYNLTCTVVGPGEAVVTSGYIGAGSGAPTPIKYLPEESQLQSKVRLQILYGGRPTTTIAVGDPLTFKLESQRGYNLVSDIFATNVIAKDPYTGRSVELIDRRGCPLDNYVFPSLGKGRDGDGLEARFNAFKIPESNFLIFEATVRTCRRGCEPALCTIGNSREEIPSYGRRRRRDANESLFYETTAPSDDEEEEEEHIHGIYEVYMSRDEIPDAEPFTVLGEVCVAPGQYYSLVAALISTLLCLVGALLALVFCFRKHRQLDTKNAAADAGNPYHNQLEQSQHLQQKSKFNFPGSHPRTLTQPASYFPSSEVPASAPQGEDGAATSSRYPDPSEPIYTDPALFERSGSSV